MPNYNVCYILDLKNQYIKRRGWWRKRAHKKEKHLEDLSHAIYSTLFQNLIFFIYFHNFYHLQLTLNTHWKDWCRSWSSNILATRCKQPTHWKRPWCWERLRARGEGDDRDNWLNGITDPVNMSLSKLRETMKTGKPGVLQFMASQKVRHDLATK